MAKSKKKAETVFLVCKETSPQLQPQAKAGRREADPQEILPDVP